MTQVFLSYSRQDAQAATRLRAELERAGHVVWRDIEEMRGGTAWRAQIRSELRQVDAMLVLLTPGSVKSETVAWEWESALTLEKPVIPLMIEPCEPPRDLASLHYHRLRTPEEYVSGFAALIRDLNELARGTSSTVPAPSSAAPAAPSTAGESFTFNISGPTHGSAIGNRPTVINQGPRSDSEPQQPRVPGAPPKKSS